MFLAIDECTQGTNKILGGILLPQTQLSILESEFVKLRLNQKLWGELKWSYINQYWERYTKFIDLLFQNPEITFHSICFRDGKKQYNAAYTLIRTITWKLQNYGYTGKLYVLFDENGSLGKEETKKIREYSSYDSKFKYELSFCNQGSSHVVGAIQLADLLCGTIHSEINSIPLKKEKESFVNHIKDKVLPLSLIHKTSGLPKLYSQKIHFFDPDDRTITPDVGEQEFNIIIPRGTPWEKLVILSQLLKISTVGGTHISYLVLPNGSDTPKKIRLPYKLNFSEDLKHKIKEILN